MIVYGNVAAIIDNSCKYYHKGKGPSNLYTIEHRTNIQIENKCIDAVVLTNDEEIIILDKEVL